MQGKYIKLRGRFFVVLCKRATMKILFVMFALIATLSACNTLQGFGKDLQRSGEAIERTAR